MASDGRHADDTHIVANNEQELTIFYKKIESVSLIYGLQVN